MLGVGKFQPQARKSEGSIDLYSEGILLFATKMVFPETPDVFRALKTARF